MIEMRKKQEAGETPAQITVSMIDQDLKNGVNKTEMSVKYGIKSWEVDRMFEHPDLKGRRPSKRKPLSFEFVDDTIKDTSDPNLNNRVAKERAEVFNESLQAASEALNPNQVTLEQAIDEAIDTVTEVKNQMQETQEAINDMLSPTEFVDKHLPVEDEDELEIPTMENTLDLVEEQEMEAGEEELKQDEDTFEL
tara:strand:+ start:380 stop:961 length:582 start_codon:yes stop_codon:yes gene_type:complete